MAKKPTAPANRHAQTRSYARIRPLPRQASVNHHSDEDTDEPDSGESEGYGKLPKRRRSARPATKARAATAASALKPDFPGVKRSKISHAQVVNSRPVKQQNQNGRSERIPPWHTLPYEVLFQIFRHASFPLVEDNFVPTKSVNWLYKSAFTCKAFAEPALSALYYAPPLWPQSRAHGLFTVLSLQSSAPTMFNYKAKVRHLELEAGATLELKYARRDPLSLMDLVELLSQLRSIRIHTSQDLPKHKGKAERVPRVHPYQHALFQTLEGRRISLSGWKWNFHIHRDDSWPWRNLSHIHNSPSFRSLSSLDVVGLTDFARRVPKKRENPTDLANALHLLQNLKYLSFVLCTFDLRFELLDNIPQQLTGLKFVDCESLTSAALAGALQHCVNLRELTLDYNRSLNLEFLQGLSASCPYLQSLRMDMTLYSSSMTTNAFNFDFTDLLPLDTDATVPTWPSSLRYIDLKYLRGWKIEAAEVFFSSLADASDELPHLRRLILRANVDGPWRERIKFRQKWANCLEAIYKRKWEDSLPCQALIQANQGGLVGLAQHHRRDDPGKYTRSRETVLSGSAGLPSLDQPVRRSSARRASAIPPQTPSETIQTLTSNEANTPSQNYQGYHIQGMCDEVDVLIDNLRPMGTQYSEADFLDDEPSDDQDYKA